MSSTQRAVTDRLGHGDVIDLLRHLNYATSTGGSCFGVAAMGMQAIMDGKLEEFNRVTKLLRYYLNIFGGPDELAKNMLAIEKKRINTIKQYKEDLLDTLGIKADMSDTDFYNLVKKSDHAAVVLYKARCRDVDSAWDPIQRELAKDVMELRAFLEGVTLHQRPEEYIDIFDKKTGAEIGQNLANTLPLILPDRLLADVKTEERSSVLPAKRSLVEKIFSRSVGLYDENALKEYFTLLKPPSSVKPPPVFMLGSGNHAITVTYVDDKYILIDANRLPTLTYDTVEGLAKDVLKSLSSTNITTFDTTIFCHERNTDAINSWLSGVTSTPAWGALRDVNGKQQQVDSFGASLLQTAAINGDIETLNALLQCNNPKVDVDHRDNEGWTALKSAIGRGHIDVVKLLLEHNATPNPNEASRDRRSPLAQAVRRNNPGVVRVLFEYKADPFQLSPKEGKTPLTIVLEDGSADVIRVFLEHAVKSGYDTRIIDLLCGALNKGEVVEADINKVQKMIDNLKSHNVHDLSILMGQLIQIIEGRPEVERYSALTGAHKELHSKILECVKLIPLIPDDENSKRLSSFVEAHTQDVARRAKEWSDKMSEVLQLQKALDQEIVPIKAEAVAIQSLSGEDFRTSADTIAKNVRAVEYLQMKVFLCRGKLEELQKTRPEFIADPNGDPNGCEVFLRLATEKEPKISDKNKLYLYRGSNGGFFYSIQEGNVNKKIQISENPNLKSLLKEQKFDGSNEKPNGCQDKNLCAAFLAITSKKNHTHPKYKDATPYDSNFDGLSKELGSCITKQSQQDSTIAGIMQVQEKAHNLLMLAAKEAKEAKEAKISVIKSIIQTRCHGKDGLLSIVSMDAETRAAVNFLIGTLEDKLDFYLHATVADADMKAYVEGVVGRLTALEGQNAQVSLHTSGLARFGIHKPPKQPTFDEVLQKLKKDLIEVFPKTQATEEVKIHF